MDCGLTERIGEEFDLKAFGARLESLRRSRLAADKLGLTRVNGSEFAKRLGIAKVRYYRYERGDIEPPMWIVSKIGELTGVSLDWLMLGRTTPGGRPEVPAEVTIGDRLRFIREACSPVIEECAGYFRVSPDMWRDYEDGKAELPLAFANEVATRFPVTLDYLYRGDLTGLERRVRHVLVTAHPELQPPLRQKNKQRTDRFVILLRLGTTPNEESPPASTAGKRGRSRKQAGDDSRVPSGTD